jgi:hypothetical protein
MMFNFFDSISDLQFMAILIGLNIIVVYVAEWVFRKWK